MTERTSTACEPKSTAVEAKVPAGVTALMVMEPKVVLIALRPEDTSVEPLKPRAAMLISPTPALMVAEIVEDEPRATAAITLLACTLPIGALKLTELKALVVAAPPPITIGAPDVVEVWRPPVESTVAPELCLKNWLAQSTIGLEFAVTLALMVRFPVSAFSSTWPLPVELSTFTEPSSCQLDP